MTLTHSERHYGLDRDFKKKKGIDPNERNVCKQKYVRVYLAFDHEQYCSICTQFLTPVKRKIVGD